MCVYCKEWQNSRAFLSKIMKIQKKNFEFVTAHLRLSQ